MHMALNIFLSVLNICDLYFQQKYQNIYFRHYNLFEDINQHLYDEVQDKKYIAKNM